MHQLMAGTLDTVIAEIRSIQHKARLQGVTERPVWPMIILRTPKGWTGPRVVDGKPVEDTWRAHQVPLAELAAKPEHLRLLEEWMKSYRAEELFDRGGKLIPSLAELAPKGEQQNGRESPRQRRPAAERPGDAGLSRVCRASRQAGNRECGSDQRTWKIPARRDAI